MKRKVRVVFYIEADPTDEAIDLNHKSGLTEDATADMMMLLDEVGATNVLIELIDP